MGNKVALGAASPTQVITSTPSSLQEEVESLRQQIEQLTAAFHVVNCLRVKDKRQQRKYDSGFDEFLNDNKDGLPDGIALIGTSERGGTQVLTVDGNQYRIGTAIFNSLSAAAEAASGVRRSGWTFWKLPDGRTVKEVFR
jgi:hypothetical protein